MRGPSHYWLIPANALFARSGKRVLPVPKTIPITVGSAGIAVPAIFIAVEIIPIAVPGVFIAVQIIPTTVPAIFITVEMTFIPVKTVSTTVKIIFTVGGNGFRESQVA